MILVVTGWRGPLSSGDAEAVRVKIEEIWAAASLTREPFALACGDASGVDACARRAAECLHAKASVFAADWNAHGKAAGPRRNWEMLCWAHSEAGPGVQVLAFPHRMKSVGTWDCVRKAVRLGLSVEICPVGGE